MKFQVYSIANRGKETIVTFVQPIYFDSQWLSYSHGFQIVDKRTGDIYKVRRYDGDLPMDRLLIVRGFNGKPISFYDVNVKEYLNKEKRSGKVYE